jgi:calcium-dependent protein kinase
MFGELLEIFQKLDTDHNGYISVEGLQKALNLVGLKVANHELRAVVSKADYLKLGKLKYTDFLMATVNLKDSLNDDLLADTFSHFDNTKKGYITSEDMHKALKTNGEFVTDKEIQ